MSKTTQARAMGVAAAAAAVAGLVAPPAAARGDIRFSEVHVDASGTNSTQDFIELRSTSGGVESLDSLTLLMVEGDSGALPTGVGTIDQILSFAGKATGDGGLFLRHSITVAAQPPPPDAATNSWVRNEGWTHENSAITYLLVSGYTGGGIGSDLDTDNDGALDVTPWTSVVDAFGVLDGNTTTDRVYAAALGGADFNDTVVGGGVVTNGVIRGVTRTPDGAFHGARFTALNATTGKWTVNNGGTLANGYDLTPGYANTAANRPAQAWVGAAGADWNLAANWTSGIVPSVAGDVAMFDGGGAAALTLSSHASVATLAFNGGSHAIAAGGGTLTMDGSGTATILVSNGNPSIAAPLALAQNTSVNVARGQSLTTADISGAGRLTKSNVGTLVLTGNNTYAGGTNLTGGTVSVGADANLGDVGGEVTFAGGTLRVTGTTLASIDARAVNWSTFNGGFDIADATHTFTISQALGGAGRLTKSGPGTLVLSGVNSHSGGTTISGGTLSVSSDANLGAAGAAVTFSGGTLRVTGTAVSNLDTRTVNFSTFNGGIDVEDAAHTFTVAQPIVTTATGRFTKAGAGTVAVTSISGNSLVVDGGTLGVAANGTPSGTTVVKAVTVAAGATLNLNDNDLIVDYPTGGTSPEFTLRDKVLLFRDGGGAEGIGFTRALPEDDRILAFGEASELGITDFNGVVVDADTVVGKYTYYGDANFDGQVTTDDYVAVDLGLGTGDSWVQGDFDLNGVVTTDDYVVVDLNLGKGTTNPLAYADEQAAMIALHTEMFGQSYVEKLTYASEFGWVAASVPEPGTIGVVVIGALASDRRRRGGKPGR